MLSEHKQTCREALEFQKETLERRAATVERHGVSGKTYRMHINAIDAALAALDEPPLPADVREAIAYIIDDYLDDSYYYDVEDSERAQKLVGIVRAWLDALPQEPTP